MDDSHNNRRIYKRNWMRKMRNLQHVVKSLKNDDSQKYDHVRVYIYIYIYIYKN